MKHRMSHSDYARQDMGKKGLKGNKKTSPPRHQEHQVSPRKHGLELVHLGVPWCLGGSHFLVD
jgi:hypothetical protein